jgi:hypothetical protein
MTIGHRAADHDGDADQSHHIGCERSPGPHAESQPNEVGGEEGCDCEGHGDIRDRRVAEGIDAEDRRGG